KLWPRRAVTMAVLKLGGRDRETLERAARHSTDARETRRALALLDLADGQTSDQVAARYRVGRSTVYEWLARWNDTQRPKSDRLRDAERSGRAPEPRDAVADAAAE